MSQNAPTHWLTLPDGRCIPVEISLDLDEFWTEAPINELSRPSLGIDESDEVPWYYTNISALLLKEGYLRAAPLTGGATQPAPVSLGLDDILLKLRSLQQALEVIGMAQKPVSYHLLAGASVSIETAIEFIQRANGDQSAPSE